MGGFAVSWSSRKAHARIMTRIGPSCRELYGRECGPSLLATLPPQLARAQRDLHRVLQIVQEHRLGLRAERVILDHGVELVVDRVAQWVEVGGAHAHPPAVHGA